MMRLAGSRRLIDRRTHLSYASTPLTRLHKAQLHHLCSSEHLLSSLSGLPLPILQRSGYSARTYVTGSTSTNSSKTDVDVQPVPSPPSSQRSKPRLDLRPAPTKPPPVTESANGSRSPSSAKQTALKQERATADPIEKRVDDSETNELESKLESESVLVKAKADVEHAVKHGVLAPPPPDAGRIRRLYHQVKELFKFYLAGLKLIFTHRREVNKIHERVRSGGQPITWAEERFIKVYRSDLVKLVPFVLILLVLEEIIPLIVLYAPGMLPSTCVLPSQRERIETKRKQKQRDAYELYRGWAVGALNKAGADGSISLGGLDAHVIKALCSLLGISDFGIELQTRRRLRKHLNLLAKEDGLLVPFLSSSTLTSEQVAEALWERGIMADKLDERAQRKRLTAWLDSVATPSRSGIAPVSEEDLRTRILLRMLADK